MGMGFLATSPFGMAGAHRSKASKVVHDACALIHKHERETRDVP